jgi:AraC-like DNA-binding protein
MPERIDNISNRPKRSGDGLSAILHRLGLRAEIFLHAELCGTWAMDTSGHRKVPFHLVEQGAAWLHTAGPDSPRRLGAGDFVVFPHDAAHCLASGPEAPAPEVINRLPEERTGRLTSLLCGFFEFRNRHAWPLLDSLPEVIVLDLREGGRHRATFPLVQMMSAEIESDQPGRAAALNQLAYLLFIDILRTRIEAGTSTGLLAAMADRQVGHALNLIHEDFRRDWSVAELARAVGTSRSVLAERFADRVGKPPMRYLAEWRMQEAAEMLRATDASVAAVAASVGYGSEMSFRKAFRKITGWTPGKVRRGDRERVSRAAGTSAPRGSAG